MMVGFPRQYAVIAAVLFSLQFNGAVATNSGGTGTLTSTGSTTTCRYNSVTYNINVAYSVAKALNCRYHTSNMYFMCTSNTSYKYCCGTFCTDVNNVYCPTCNVTNLPGTSSAGLTNACTSAGKLAYGTSCNTRCAYGYQRAAGVTADYTTFSCTLSIGAQGPTPAFSCVPAPCPENSDPFNTSTATPQCACRTGFTGSITWNAVTQQWSGSCTRAASLCDTVVDRDINCGPPAITSCGLSPQNTSRCICNSAGARADFLTGMASAVSMPGASASPLILISRNAFPLFVAPNNQQVVAAAAYLYQGRVVATGHETMINTAAGTDVSKFVVNAVKWASAGSGLTKKIAVHSSLSNAGPVLTANSYTVVALNLNNLTGIDAIVTTNYVAYTDAEIAIIKAFVSTGGGLVTGGQAWYWSSQNPTLDITAFPGNRLLNMVGIVIPNDIIWYNAYNATATTEYSHVQCAFDGILRNTVGDTPLTLAQRNIAKDTTLAATNAIAVSSPFFAPMISFSNTVGPIEPTESVPLSTSQYRRIMAAAIQAKLALTSAPNATVAHSSSSYFPGAVPSAEPRISKTLTIVATDPGNPMDYTTPTGVAWRSTGLYAAPGDTITVTVPSAAAGQGLSVRIGCHTDVLFSATSWVRFPEVTNTAQLKTTVTQLANGFGGPVYIVVPAGLNLGPISVTIDGAVAMGWHVMGRDGDTELAAMKLYQAPWFEWESNGWIFTVPSESMAAVTTMVDLHNYWNQSAQLAGFLAGFDRTLFRAERLVHDRQITNGAMHAGYPIMAYINPYVGHSLLDGLGDGTWGHFHETGHNLVWRDVLLDGTGEAVNNLWSVYLSEKVANKTGADAHPNIAPAERQAVVTSWKANPNPANWNTWVALETYLQLQERFGWSFYEQLFAAYRSMPVGQRPADNNNARVQKWVIMSSQYAGYNLINFYQAWAFNIDQSTIDALAGLPEWLDHPMV